MSNTVTPDPHNSMSTARNAPNERGEEANIPLIRRPEARLENNIGRSSGAVPDLEANIGTEENLRGRFHRIQGRMTNAASGVTDTLRETGVSGAARLVASSATGCKLGNIFSDAFLVNNPLERTFYLTAGAATGAFFALWSLRDNVREARNAENEEPLPFTLGQQQPHQA